MKLPFSWHESHPCAGVTNTSALKGANRKPYGFVCDGCGGLLNICVTDEERGVYYFYDRPDSNIHTNLSLPKELRPAPHHCLPSAVRATLESRT